MDNVVDMSAQRYSIRKFEKTSIYPGYQLNISYSLPNEDSLSTFRFVVLLIQKWMEEKLPFYDEKATDPMAFHNASDDSFSSYILDENAFVWNVTYLKETHEWAARLRETDSFTTPNEDDKPSEGRVFITRIAVKVLNDKEVGIGCKIDVIESEKMSDLPYAYRPRFVRWLFSPTEIEPDCNLHPLIRQGNRRLSVSAEELSSKTAINDLKNSWKSSDNSLQWVFFTKESVRPVINKDAVIPNLLLSNNDRSFTNQTEQTEQSDYDALTTAQRFAKANFGYVQTFFVPEPMLNYIKNSFQIKSVEPGSVFVVAPRCYGNDESSNSESISQSVTYYAPDDVSRKPFYEMLREGVRKRGVNKSISFGQLLWEKDLVVKKDQLTIVNVRKSSNDDLAAQNAEYLKIIERDEIAIRGLQDEKSRLLAQNSILIANSETISKSELDKKDLEILRMKDQLQKLSNKFDEQYRANQSLMAENDGLKNKLNQIERCPVLYEGNETEKFPGEVKDIVLSTLEDALKALTQPSRRADVIRDIIDNNDYEHILKDRAEKLKVKLTGYKTMKYSISDFLEEIGLVLISEKEHYKYRYYNDPRYDTILAKSASDSWRGDLNAALDIIRNMM